MQRLGGHQDLSGPQAEWGPNQEDKKDLSGFRQKLHEKFQDIPLAKLCFSYKLKKANSKQWETYVVEPQDDEESIEIFYIMACNMLELLVFAGKKNLKTRNS